MIYIALLRGINVSGSNLIRMESLKKSLDASGLSHVTTYIQSGNILFSHDILDKQYLEKHITDTINKDFGFLVPVHIRTLGELENIIQSNPFITEHHHPVDTLHATFLSGIPDSELATQILPGKDGDDEMIAVKDVIYLNCPTGYGRTKFTNTYLEKKLKVKATTRNWKTVVKLKELATIK